MSHFDDQEQQEHGENEAAGDQRRAGEEHGQEEGSIVPRGPL